MPRNGRLTPMEDRFCHEYPVDFDGKAAALRAGYAEKSAHVTASRMLRKPLIRKRMAQILRQRAKAADVEVERVLKELAAVAYSDLREVCEWADGIGVRVIDSKDLTDRAAAAVKKVKMRETETRRVQKDGSEDITVYRETEVEMHSKQPALDGLARYLGMLTGEGAETGEFRPVALMPIREPQPGEIVRYDH